MPRPLTKVEQGYIRDCLHIGETDAKVIAKELAGVGPVTVQAFIDGLTASRETIVVSADDVGQLPSEFLSPEAAPEPEGEELTLEEIEAEMKRKENESEIEKQLRIAHDNRLTANRLLGRKDGIVVMTEGASEMIDARKTLQPNPTSIEQLEKQKTRIHRPFNGPNEGGAKNRSTRTRI